MYKYKTIKSFKYKVLKLSFQKLQKYVINSI